MPPCEVSPQSARKRKGEPCCLATSTRGHASIYNSNPQPCTHKWARLHREGKSPPIENGQCQTNKKTKVTSERTQDAGLTRTSNLGRCPNNRGTLHLHYLACSCPIKHETFNCPLTAPSCFVQVEKAKLPFNSRTGALTRHQGSSGSRERTSLLDSSPQEKVLGYGVNPLGYPSLDFGCAVYS